MTKINSLKELLIDELKDLHNAESQLTKALPKMAEAATDEDLKQAFVGHLEQTIGHVERLERAFTILGESAKDKPCKAMQGLIKEGKEAIDEKGPGAVKDANLIGAAQRVEHYEMAAYGTARAFATLMGEKEIASLLTETLEEESGANGKLTELSTLINEAALHAFAV